MGHDTNAEILPVLCSHHRRRCLHVPFHHARHSFCHHRRAQCSDLTSGTIQHSNRSAAVFKLKFSPAQRLLSPKFTSGMDDDILRHTFQFNDLSMHGAGIDQERTDSRHRLSCPSGHSHHQQHPEQQDTNTQLHNQPSSAHSSLLARSLPCEQTNSPLTVSCRKADHQFTADRRKEGGYREPQLLRLSALLPVYSGLSRSHELFRRSMKPLTA